MHRVSIEGKSPYKESYKVTEKYLVMKFSKKLLNCSDQTRTGVFNLVWLFTFKMYRKELALICILIQEAYVKKFFSKIAFLHILNVYSHTKLNTSSCLITALKQLGADSRYQTFFRDYWLNKIPSEEISPLYLLYDYTKYNKDNIWIIYW